MIDAALRANIRRLFYAELWRIGTISAELDVHHDTVRNAIESDRFFRSGTQIRPTLLDPYKALIEKTLDDYPRLRATRIFEMIRARGYPGSRCVHQSDDGRARAAQHEDLPTRLRLC